MTRTWKRAGLEIIKGQNHFTIGRIVGPISARFDPNSALYQSWLGGYSVSVESGKSWSIEDYCNLVIADQNSWLRWYGDPAPFTSVDGWKFNNIGKIVISDGIAGVLYEGGFNSHSDVGSTLNSPRFFFATNSLAALYNLSNSKLKLSAESFIPRNVGFPYHPIEGRVYLGVFEVTSTVRVVLYANGFKKASLSIDTFDALKHEFLKTMNACTIEVIR